MGTRAGRAVAVLSAVQAATLIGAAAFDAFAPPDAVTRYRWAPAIGPGWLLAVVAVWGAATLALGLRPTRARLLALVALQVPLFVLAVTTLVATRMTRRALVECAWELAVAGGLAVASARRAART